jgi:hypothetical protein
VSAIPGGRVGSGRRVGLVVWVLVAELRRILRRRTTIGHGGGVGGGPEVAGGGSEVAEAEGAGKSNSKAGL